MRFVQNTAWATSEIETLKRLRAEGVSLREIGRRLNRSHHSVASKVRKLALPLLPTESRPRPSPEPTPEPVQRAGRTTLARLPSLKDL